MPDLPIRQRVRMDRHPRNLHPFLGPMFPIDLQRLQLRQRRIAPLNHATKDGILPVQMRRRRVRDEELTPVRPRAAVRHADDAAPVVPQAGPDFVLELALPDRRAAFAFAGRVARLHDEAGDGPVDERVVVVAGRAVGEEVLGCFGHAFAEDLELEITERGVQLLWKIGLSVGVGLRG